VPHYAYRPVPGELITSGRRHSSVFYRRSDQEKPVAGASYATTRVIPWPGTRGSTERFGDDSLDRRCGHYEIMLHEASIDKSVVGLRPNHDQREWPNERECSILDYNLN
jgi:hypothetical protein